MIVVVEHIRLLPRGHEFSQVRPSSLDASSIEPDIYLIRFCKHDNIVDTCSTQSAAPALPFQQPLPTFSASARLRVDVYRIKSCSRDDKNPDTRVTYSLVNAGLPHIRKDMSKPCITASSLKRVLVSSTLPFWCGTSQSLACPHRPDGARVYRRPTKIDESTEGCQ